jgi:hypothetical protein
MRGVRKSKSAGQADWLVVAVQRGNWGAVPYVCYGRTREWLKV